MHKRGFQAGSDKEHSGDVCSAHEPRSDKVSTGLKATLSPTSERDVNIGALRLDNGSVLDSVVQRVSVYGDPLADGSNVVLINHALTGSSRIADWWPNVFGEGKLLDTSRLAVIGINVLGSCYGSTSPATLSSGTPYGSRFPVITVADMVRAQRAALRIMGIERLALVIGSSLGGMQAQQWAVDFHADVDAAIVIGAYDHFAPFGIALNGLSREAIYADPAFLGGDYYDRDTPRAGLKLARMIAMVTYKSEALFAHRFGRKVDRKGGDPYSVPRDRFDVEGYLEYQGRIFIERMDPNSYLSVTRSMDLFDLRDRSAPAPRPKLTFVGISSDWLFPSREIEATATRYAQKGFESTYLLMESDHGHDAFLAEPEHLATLLAPVLERFNGR
jgi:homoserine O-acetyltransferase